MRKTKFYSPQDIVTVRDSIMAVCHVSVLVLSIKRVQLVLRVQLMVVGRIIPVMDHVQQRMKLKTKN